MSLELPQKPTPRSSGIRVEDLDHGEQAATDNLSSVEQNHPSMGSDNLENPDESNRNAARRRFQTIARRVIQFKDQTGATSNDSYRESTSNRRHRKTQSAHTMLEFMNEDPQQIYSLNDGRSGNGINREESMRRANKNETNMLFVSANLASRSSTENEASSVETRRRVQAGNGRSEEHIPLFQQQDEDMHDGNQERTGQPNSMNVFHCLRQCLPRKTFSLMFWKQLFHEHVLHSFLTYIALPCFVLSWILFYFVGNPAFDFLPENAGRISWWLNFTGRQVLMLELSRLTQWLLLDCFMLGTSNSVKFMGPLATLMSIQAKGWPFLLTAWGLLDMCLLHGDNKFQLHWFYWTGFEIYNTEIGSNIMNDKTYLRILLAAIIAGLTTTAKRTYLEVYFGRSQLVDFKPRLEKLLADIVLLNEVANLAEEADSIARDTSESLDPELESTSRTENSKQRAADSKPAATNKGLSPIVYSTVHFTDDTGVKNAGFSQQQQDDDRFSTMLQRDLSKNSGMDLSKNESHDLSRTSSGTLQMKSFLDRWEEPVTVSGKKDHSVTIMEVLRFRRALACMDEAYPFGEAFGLANTRDACIQSANSLYFQLMKLEPTAKQLAYEVLELAIVEGDTTSEEYEMKKAAFRKLFRPDENDELPLVAFVQSCDHVYRRLRFFIASVRNSSVIDYALEDTFNYFFYFVLVLLLMSVMRLNPWPMLVSVTSLLVSISFALGPSVSKFVEGILLIAARRPYDLGDRIIVTDSNCLTNPGVAESWFVEDINLWSTTLRYARTNEVSTVNNSAIAASRIINCNRSPNAMVMFSFVTNSTLLEGNKIDEFRKALELYVKKNPRVWEAVAFVRHEEYDTDFEKIFIRLGFRHRSSWQDAARILHNRGQLHRFVFETGKRMNISFRTPIPPRIYYQGGEWPPNPPNDGKAK